MESKKESSYTYKVEDSASRMDDILDADDNDYQDNENSIPARNKLTYKNGYYVNVTALFIDIVDSSKLTDGHKRPTLAKMYRAFLSECVAIMNSWEMCKEINIMVIVFGEFLKLLKNRMLIMSFLWLLS